MARKSSKKHKKQVCGLVMPISSIDGLPEAHWLEVRTILSEAIEKAGFKPSLVSDADDVGVIQKRIIQNLYDNPIVVVDMSAKNPNVMFELGMRLAFDKPTIIVKDDQTTYAFDTSPIEHVSYPRDLRFANIVEFKEKLADKIRGTHKKATTDPAYTTFLKHFGKFTVVKLDEQEVSTQEFVLEELRLLRRSVDSLRVPRLPFGKQVVDDDAKDWIGTSQLWVHGVIAGEREEVFNRCAREGIRARIATDYKIEGESGVLILRYPIDEEKLRAFVQKFTDYGFETLLAG